MDNGKAGRGGDSQSGSLEGLMQKIKLCMSRTILKIKCNLMVTLV